MMTKPIEAGWAVLSPAGARDHDKPSDFTATRFKFVSMGEWVLEAESGKRGGATTADITFR